MMRLFQAYEYQEPADRGLNRPIKLRARTAAGEDALIFVKTRLGYGGRPAAPGIETFCTLLARELGLLAPEPVIVEIPPGFERLVFDNFEFRELVAGSHGRNFGTISLGPDWKTWLVEMSTRSFPKATIENILTFDGLVQHTDRLPINPNLMWRHGELAVIDHEKCFGYLSTAEDVERPWRSFLRLRPFQTHCLRGTVDIDQNFGTAMRENLIGLELMNRVPELISAAIGAFPESEVELNRILRYFELLGKDAPDFFDYLRFSLDQ